MHLPSTEVIAKSAEPSGRSLFRISNPRVQLLSGYFGLLLLLMLIFLAAGGSFLLQRSPWMDEVHTLLLVHDGSLSRAMEALQDGVDFNPPAYFLTARSWLTVTNSNSEFSLRIFSLLLMTGALSLAYAGAAQRFGAIPALIAVLLIAAHPVIVHQSTEMRFYSLWAAALMALCRLLPDTDTSFSVRRHILLILLSCIVCTSHYFGIVSLGLVVGGQAIACRFRNRRLWTGLLTGLCGLLSVAACWPFLSGQKQALSRPTWISPATIPDSLDFLWASLPLGSVAGCLLAFIISRGLSVKSHPGNQSLVFDRLRRAFLMPETALVFLPIVLILFSWTVQPALVPRYATLAAFGCVPSAASLLSLCSPAVNRFILALVVLTAGNSVYTCVNQWKSFESTLAQAERAVETTPARSIVICEDRSVWFPLIYRRPDLAARSFLADFTDAQMSVDSDLRVVQRDAGRRTTLWYPRMKMQSLGSLTDYSRFFVMPYSGGSGQDLKYPSGYRSMRYSQHLWEFLRDANPKVSGGSEGGAVCPDNDTVQAPTESPSNLPGKIFDPGNT